MDLEQLEAIARRELAKNGLHGWTFGLADTKRRLGVCKYRARRIEIAEFFARNSPPETVLDTLLHEIAHALAGPAARHGPAWKAVAIRLGATPRACETEHRAVEGEQRQLLQRHGRQARHHIDTLASKAYHAQFHASPEFVVMFIPNEAVYCAALEADPTLLAHGAAKGVLIATPTTLIALLHATHYGWRQEKIADSAREIAAAGRELHKRIASFLEPYAKLGRQLNSAVNAYNQGAGSLEARVLPQLRRIEEAGAGSAKDLAPPVAVDTPAKLLAAPELTERVDLPPAEAA